MALEVIFAPEALHDLEDIGDFIAKDNPDKAREWVFVLERHCHFLGEKPFKAPVRDDLRAGYRVLAIGEYLVFYRVVDEEVLISRVLHGARDTGRAFGDDNDS